MSGSLRVDDDARFPAHPTASDRGIEHLLSTGNQRVHNVDESAHPTNKAESMWWATTTLFGGPVDSFILPSVIFLASV